MAFAQALEQENDVLHAHCTDIEGVKTVRPKNVKN